MIDVLRDLSKRKNASVAQLAIAWLLHQPQVTSVVIGVRRIEQLRENVGAVDVTLSADELQALDAASALPAEYPGWMLDMWSGARAQQLAATRAALA